MPAVVPIGARSIARLGTAQERLFSDSRGGTPLFLPASAALRCMLYCALTVALLADEQQRLRS